MKKNFLIGGFTLTEILVAILVFALIIIAIYSTFNLSQRALKENERSAEILQNGRVILERMSREIRQAREIVTELPATDTIEFEDGHISELYHYIRYYKENGNIKRRVIGYYFSGDPEKNLVPWDSTPPEGQTLETIIIEAPETVGEYVNSISFSGSKIINISLVLTKQNKTLNLSTKIFGRNF